MKTLEKPLMPRIKIRKRERINWAEYEDFGYRGIEKEVLQISRQA